MSTVQERIENNKRFVRIISLNPSFRLLLFYVSGIAILSAFKISLIVIGIFAVLFLLFLLIKKWKFPAYLFGVLTISAFTALQIQNFPTYSKDIVLPDLPGTFDGYVDNIIKTSDKSIRLKVSGNINLKDADPFTDCGVFLTVFRPDDKCRSLKSGNRIYFSGNFAIPRKRILPTDFDNAIYARNNDVSFFATTSSATLAIRNRKKNFRGFCQIISDNLCAMADRLFRPDYAPIVKALLLGDKTTMPYETKQLFALSGTAHVLAVSGLHTGIITSIVLLFSGFIRPGRYQRLIKFLILAVSLFAYAALTGFSPSVCRAAFVAVMTYFVFIIERFPVPINILSFCVFLLLLLFPHFYLSIGFRMSVCSVFAIIFFYGSLNKNISFLLRNIKVKSTFVSSSLALTFSASIAISPLIAYYFGYFSILSPIANLLVIPLMSLAMISAIIVFPLSYICFPIANYLANSTDLLIMLSTEINKFIVSLPFSYASGKLMFPLSIASSVVILYLLTFKHLRQFYFRFGVVILCSLGVCVILQSPFLRHRETVSIYPLKNLSVAEIPMTNGKIFYYLADRRNKQFAVGDYNLKNYLASQLDDERNIVLGLTGNVGIATYDLLKAKYKKQIKPIALSIEEQRKIDSLLGLKQRLPQITKEIKI